MKLPSFDHLQTIPLEWDQTRRQAAVVMLFLNDQSHSPAHVVLTRRSLNVGTHKGQIGFPGGRADPEDRGPSDTALRELREELGVPSDTVTLHGMIPPTIALDKSPVTAIVGSTDYPLSKFVPSPDEVAEVFTAPWTELTRAKSQPFRFNMFGNWRESQLFMIGTNRVWGLTAHLIFAADL